MGATCYSQVLNNKFSIHNDHSFHHPYFETGRAIIAGITARTNEKGLENLAHVFKHIPLIPVHLGELIDYARKHAAATGQPEPEEVLHLKSFCSMCADDLIVAGGPLGQALELCVKRDLPFGQHFLQIPDAAAANVVYVNDTLIRRSRTEYPASEPLFRAHIPKWIRHVEIEAGELAKVDGALTCCSLLLH